jgi:hypothetical protein
MADGPADYALFVGTKLIACAAPSLPTSKRIVPISAPKASAFTARPFRIVTFCK